MRDFTMSTKQYYIMKWIAMISMLIDHVASAFYEVFNWDTNFYIFCRTIGRLAFPLFCFMLVESFYFTKNRLIHFEKIAILAILSEIPFDLAFYSSFIYMGYQNVCITLALGFVMLFITLFGKRYGSEYIDEYVKSDAVVKRFIIPVFDILLLFVFGVTASMLSADYGFSGIFLIWGFNLARSAPNANLRRAAVIIAFILLRLDIMYAACLVDLGIIYILTRKDGNSDETKFSEIITGKRSKAICSMFYPAHLAIIAVCKLIF